MMYAVVPLVMWTILSTTATTVVLVDL